MKRFVFLANIFLCILFLGQKGWAQSQTVTNGQPTSPITFPGTGCFYLWENDTPGIGLSASGNGTVPSFIAINKGNTPIRATITGVPELNGFAYVPNANDSNVYVINTYTGVAINSIPVGASPQGVSVSADGTRVYVTDALGVSVINTGNNTVIATIATGPYPYGIAVSPDGSRVYAVGRDTMSVIDATANTLLTKIKVGSGASGVAVSPDGSRVYVTNQNDNTVCVVSSATNAVVTTITLPANTTPDGIAVSPDGSRVYVTGYLGNSVLVINAADNTLVSTIAVGAFPVGIAVSPDGSRVYVANAGESTVSVINTKSNTVVGTITSGNEPVGISVNPDGRFIYVANEGSNNVSVISTATNTVTSTIKVGSTPISFGNFLTGGVGCSPVVVLDSIVIDPSPSSAPVISASLPSGNISVCVGKASSSPDIEQFTVSGSNLTGNVTATIPAGSGFEISLSPASGYSSSLNITPSGGAINNAVVYVRSAAADAPGYFTSAVTLAAAGTAGQTIPVNGTVKALPTVDKPPDQVVNNGATTTAIKFKGTGSIFNWTNDKPGIGLAATGTGDIASFTAINKGLSPIVATITVTPQAAGYAYITNSNSNSVSVINTTTHAVDATIPVGWKPAGVTVSHDGNSIYVSNGNGSNVGTNAVLGTISSISAATNAEVNTTEIQLEPWGIALSPDGSRLYEVNAIGESMEVINTITNTVISTTPLGEVPFGVAISRDGSKLYAGNYDYDYVWVINAATGAVTDTIQVGKRPAQLAVSPDGSRLYTANVTDGTVSVINTANDAVLATIALGDAQASYLGYPEGIAVSPDGKRVYVSNYAQNTVAVINTATNAVIATVAVGAGPSGVSVTPDGKEVFVANYTDGTVSIINTATNAVSATVQVGSQPYALGNFITAPSGCPGMPVTFTITVNPSPILIPTIVADTTTGNIAACLGTASASPYLQQFAVSGAKLTGDITATAPAGFEISLNPGNGFGNTVTIGELAGNVSNVVVYVRSAASATVGAITGNVVLSSAGAASQIVAVTGNVAATVSPAVTIAATANSICAGTPVTFTALPTNGGSTPAFQWTVNGINAGTNTNTFTSNTLADGDVVSCTITSNAACAAPANATASPIVINVITPPIPSATVAASANNICAGTLVTFTATAIAGGDAPVFQWTLNGNPVGTNLATFSSSSLNNGDIVTCTVTSTAGCVANANAAAKPIAMVVSPLPTVMAGGDKNIFEGNAVTLNAKAPGNISNITWSPATGLNNPKIINPVANPRVTTKYTVTVQTAAGCVAADSLTVTVVPPGVTIPNTFTPNADGVNDTWDIKYLDLYPSCTVMVYNRWGQLVYSCIGYPVPWDGTYGGAPLPTGTYYYVIDLKNGSKLLSGFVAIVR